MHVRTGILLSTLASAVLAGCGGSSAPSGPATVAVAIKNFTFAPGTITVSPGTKVTWTQDDNTVHTVTAVDSSFDSGNLSQNQSFSHTFSTAGTFAYRCNIHQYMTGTIVVK
jgi:plastocyanin